MYKLKDNECILSINTTGINKNSNHIFLINIWDNDQYYHFYSPSNTTEKSIVMKAVEILKNKFIITYNGSHFDIEFLNKKSYQYGIKTVLESGLDIYQQLKSYYVFKDEKLTLSSLSLNYLKKEYIDQKQIINEYKSNPLNKNLFIVAGKDALKTRYDLYCLYYQTLEKNSSIINIYDLSYRLSLYNYKENKNQFSLKYVNLDYLSISYDNEFFSVRSTKEYVQICFPLYQAKSVDMEDIKYIYAPFTTEYEEDVLPIIHAKKFDRSTIEDLSRRVLEKINF